MVTSANPPDLRQFVDNGAARRASDQDLLTGAITSSNSVRELSLDFHPQTNALARGGALLESLKLNERFVAGVHDAVVAADHFNGSPVVDDRQIAMILNNRGLLARPSVIAIERMTLYGISPTSGFVDDPICAANGNFVHGDMDLRFPGFSGCLNLVRVYNSLAHPRLGAFGRGWSSTLDMNVNTDDTGLVRVALADGAVVGFPQDDDANYLPDHRRHLTLQREESGWKLTSNFSDSWSFDVDGRVSGITSGVAVAQVDRSAGRLRITEQLSGRSITYLVEGGLVKEALSSDGRKCNYQYDLGANLVAVDRPAGSLRYTVENNVLVAVADADGVKVCQNLYDLEGRVVEQITAHGRTSIYTYDGLGTTHISDNENGPENVLVHDRHGNVTSVFDGLGNDMHLEYDRVGRVTRLFDRVGAKTSYTYGDDGLIATRLDPDGRSHEWIWDEWGRLLTETDRSGGETRYEYKGNGRTPTAVVTPNGNKSRITTDERDLPIDLSDADGVVTHFDWDPDGQMSGVMDALGNRTDFRYDERGHLIEAINASGVFARFALDAAGRATSATSADGTQHFTYSKAGRLQSSTETDGGTWTAGYDGAGEVDRLTDAAGGVLRLARDSHGNITTFTAPDGLVFEHEYDELGRLSCAIDPAGNATRLGYDAEGRSTSVIDASGLEWRRTVDFSGRTLSVTAPDGSTSTRAYHANGELASTTDAAGSTWTHSVDPEGNLIKSVDALGGIRSYTRSPAGRPVRERSPGGRVVERAFDKTGRLVSGHEGGRITSFVRRPDGQVRTIQEGPATINFDHDKMGRLSGVQGPGLSSTQIWQHGRIVEDKTGGACSTFRWDLRGLLTHVTDPAGVGTDLEYDITGRLVGRLTDDQRVTASYGAAGFVQQIVDTLGNATDMTTDPPGLLREVHFPDGRGLCLDYNTLGLPEGVRTSEGIEVARFSHDAVGRVLSASSGDHVTVVEHDGLGQVAAVIAPFCRLRYERDLDGVIERLDEASSVVLYRRDEYGSLLGFELDHGSLVDLPGQRSVIRDEFGRIQRDELGNRFSYDAAGRLAECNRTDGLLTVYSYGQKGLLEAEHEGSSSQQFVYNPGGQLMQRIQRDSRLTYSYDAVGRRIRDLGDDGSSVRYEWDDLDRLVAIERHDRGGSSVTHSITHDGFNNPVLIDNVPIVWDLGHSGKAIRLGDLRYLRHGGQVHLLSLDGSWTAGLSDDPWGNDGAEGLRIGFRGEVALGPLVFMGARVYDAAARCFLTPDPAEPVPGAVTFAGPYSYAWNDPVNYVDPTGLRPLSDRDYDEIRRRQDRGMFEKAFNAMVEDPWGTVAMVGVVAVGAALIVFAAPVAAVVGVAAATVGAVGAGVLVASGLGAGIGLVTGTFDPRRVALGGALGAFLPGGSVLAHLAVGATTGGAFSMLDQVIVQGSGINEINVGDIVFSSILGAATLGLGKVVTNHLPIMGRSAATHAGSEVQNLRVGAAQVRTGLTLVTAPTRTLEVAANRSLVTIGNTVRGGTHLTTPPMGGLVRDASLRLRSPAGTGNPVDVAATRPKMWVGTKSEIQRNAPKTREGQAYDPNTLQPISLEGTFDYGHRPGFEWWRTQQMARELGWTRQQLIEFENNAGHFQIETQSSNRGHTYEMPRSR